jgi:DNA-binding response OmpR family regulator
MASLPGDFDKSSNKRREKCALFGRRTTPLELLARIRAALRRVSLGSTPSEDRNSRIDDQSRKENRGVNDSRIHLSPKEFEVLRALVIQQGRLLTHKKLLQTVRGPDHGEENRNPSQSDKHSSKENRA